MIEDKSNSISVGRKEIWGNWHRCWKRACVEIAVRVMPLTSLVADAFGAVTLALVILFTAVGLFCIAYVLYFRSQIPSDSDNDSGSGSGSGSCYQLQYFNAPWIIRITLIVYAILWSLGEIFRLSLLKKEGWLLHPLTTRWQRNVCRVYLLSNLGLMEPGIILTVIFLVRGSLYPEMSRIKRWNRRVITFVLILCVPVFAAQLFFLVISSSFEFRNGYNEKKEGYGARIPKYFTRAFQESRGEVYCTYPLFCTIVYGVFVCLCITYFLYVAMRMISLVINKGLQRRVYWLIFAVGLLPLRILFLGFSLLSTPGRPVFESLVFLGFLALIACATVGVGVLVYLPVSDSLAVKWICRTRENNRRHQQSHMIPMESFSRTLSGFVSDNDDDASIAATESLLEGAMTTSVGRDSDSSTKVGSISFRTMLKDVSSEPVEEVNLFVETGRMLASPPGSPPLPGKPMVSFAERNL